MAGKKKNRTNTLLLSLGMILIVVDALVMSLPGLSETMIKVMLVGSIVICAALIVIMSWNIIRDGRKIKRGEGEEE